MPSTLPAHRAWLDRERSRLLAFGRRVGLDGGGAAYLGDDGEPAPEFGVQTWITARMVYVYSLGHLLGAPGSGPIADAAMAGLTGRLRDREHGGWFRALDASGMPDAAAGKSCYDHAFVMLAASAAVLAERPGAQSLLSDATEIYLQYFWDATVGLPVDTWDVTFTRADDYRGVNATMHSVEALLAVADSVPAEDAHAWRARALSAVQFVITMAQAHADRIPEHYSACWQPDLNLNQDNPGDQFKPFGATPGHGLEWARLILNTEAVTGTDPELVVAATRLFDRAVADGWAADGAEGFVYTTDWDGVPVVSQRMHWVLAEAINSAAVLYRRTADPRFAQWYTTWWDYARRHLIDVERGSWLHELDSANRPAATVWPGKPDLYHAFQTTLIPQLPLAPTLARALREGLLR
ncbi:N-acyl-D-glucosamine 2-epimerase [Mycobacterium sp. MS1601]|uniref:AGE family epimerase/isomerase n=1 Tax=Mycobacterium sp. MS1601 TaxID=1936029 RepID=UPI0009794E29|nr:AGE family epimerase/isomerase [Mycobacterium sp. MS1601]AQA02867.1 N-acyl-D-glucosamine 2-epimerase [Mycobacterium sp. MS1601]